MLVGLTEPQVRAVTHVEGPLLVIAGPGSGKTRVITHRIAYLVRHVGIAPWNILAVTFTNKAAGEMKQRIADLVSADQARAITLCTFHSFCARLLRHNAQRLGLAPGYSIYDSSDQQRAIKGALEDLEISTKNFPPAKMLATISNAKNQLIDAEAFALDAQDFYSRTVAKVYTKYAAILERNEALDFDDLLMRSIELMRNFPDVQKQLVERYKYVLIDEYQDTNHAQFMIASILGQHRNIMVTGDPDQSIYAWRGADIRNILDFEQHYPESKDSVIHLEQNYRSTKCILAVADALIQNNRTRKHKTLWTDNDQGDPVEQVTCRDERGEARWVVEQFQQLHDKHDAPWNSMAVFYRINSLSRVIEDELRTAGVPYQIARGTSFYDRKEIKDAVGFLRVIVNRADEVNLWRVINTPARGISPRSVDALGAYALANHRPIDDVLADPLHITALNSRAQNAVLRFWTMVEKWRKLAGLSGEADQPTTQMSLRGFVELVLRDSGMEEHYRNDKSDPDQERLANLGELVSSAQQFEDQYVHEVELDSDRLKPSLTELLLEYLEQISLVSDVDAVNPDQGAVTLMTLHAAKGLEFDTVMMIGLEEGLLPHQRARASQKELEEERRLCFVGITRAMSRLCLCRAQTRTIFGQTMPTFPSRFLDELPSSEIKQITLEDSERHGLAFDSQAGRTSAAREAGAFAPGTLVRHPSFGLGRVANVAAMGQHTRARIDFNEVGPKTIILQYARLEKVE